MKHGRMKNNISYLLCQIPIAPTLIGKTRHISLISHLSGYHQRKNMLFPTKLFILTASFLIALSMGCGRDNHIETLIIGPYTQTCQGFIEQQCYLVFNEESQKWEFFYESIQGFNFEPGYIYTLKVRLEDRGTEIQDVGRYAYHLVEVISKEAASIDEKPPRKP